MWCLFSILSKYLPGHIEDILGNCLGIFEFFRGIVGVCWGMMGVYLWYVGVNRGYTGIYCLFSI